MPKAKLFAKGGDVKKKGKLPKAQPSSADEYLEAGVDFEEAGEKWRGGDAAKSTRFFVRAIECYEEALAKFPASFDLAYNKARVQYELTQYPKLLAQLPGTLLELLETALTSSRYALSLKSDNAEVLYTTAQILSSLAEVSTPTSQSTHDPLPLLEESLTLFQQCLTIQETLFSQSQNEPQPPSPSTFDNDNDTEDGGAPLSSTPTSTTNVVQEEQWASILEPITSSTLLDTITAQLEVLTQITPLITTSSHLTYIDTYSAPLLTQKLPTLTPTVSPDAALFATITAATFISTFSDTNFSHGLISSPIYLDTLTKTWGSFDFATSPEGLVAAAEALIAFNASLRTSSASTSSLLSTRWKALTTAQTHLTSASKLPNVPELAKIHLLRGDVDLLRCALGKEGFEVANKSRTVLLGNAGKFYRGAKALAGGVQGGEGVVREAVVKEGIIKVLSGDESGLKDAVGVVGEEGSTRVIGECFSEGLLSEEETEEMLRL